MKYDFLVKENSSDKVDKEKDNKSFIGSTMLSTYEDFNIFLKKKSENDINEISIKNNDDETNNIKKKKYNEEKKIDNSTYFESEKKTVETIVKYSSSLINLLLKIYEILKKALINLISKKNINTEIKKDIEIINKFNRHMKKKKNFLINNKNNERKEVDKKRNTKIKEDNHIKKMNSYLIELE